jgi:hypothetical protein
VYRESALQDPGVSVEEPQRVIGLEDIKAE